MRFNFLRRLGWTHTTKSSRACLPAGESVVISEGSKVSSKLEWEGRDYESVLGPG